MDRNRRNRRHDRRLRRGFSLIEVLLAVFILGIGIISIGAIFPAGIVQQRQSLDDALGPVVLGQKDSQPFLGRDLGHQADYSGQVAFRIDQEIRALIDEAHDEALEILVENADVLDTLANTLLEVETVEGALLAEVLAPIRLRADRGLPVPDHSDPQQVIATLRRRAATNGHLSTTVAAAGAADASMDDGGTW